MNDWMDSNNYMNHKLQKTDDPRSKIVHYLDQETLDRDSTAISLLFRTQWLANHSLAFAAQNSASPSRSLLALIYCKNLLHRRELAMGAETRYEDSLVLIRALSEAC